MKKALLAGVLLSLVLAGMAKAEFASSDWQYRKSIKAPGTTGFVLLNLDTEVFSHADPALADLRLQDDLGKEVPYTMVPEGEISVRTGLPAKMFDKHFIKGQYTQLTLDVGSAGLLHNQLIIDTGSENFRRLVEVEGSNDRSTWASLAVNGQIYDYSVSGLKPVKVQDTIVDYPESTVQYLRLKILDNGGAPLDIKGVTVFHDVNSVAKEIEFKPTLEISTTPASRGTEIITDLGNQGIPTRRAILNIADNNFNRHVALLGSNERQNWNFLADGYIFKVSSIKFKGKQLTLNYPETQYRYLKLIINNGDDSPLTVKEIKLFGVLRTLAFKHEPARSYYLYYGNKSAPWPQYDLEKLFPYLEKQSMGTVILGQEESNPDYKAPPAPPVPFSERHPNILLAVLGIIVIVMGLLITRLYSKVTKT